jgi:ParB-like chromosome segregation protein Spo0J
VIQPVIVRPLGEGRRLVAGERRWRAAQRRGCMKFRRWCGAFPNAR